MAKIHLLLLDDHTLFRAMLSRLLETESDFHVVAYSSSSQEALETGKLVATSESGRTYDFFRGRLMIPIHNDAGEVVAFSGRLLDPEAKAPPFLSPPMLRNSWKILVNPVSTSKALFREVRTACELRSGSGVPAPG